MVLPTRGHIIYLHFHRRFPLETELSFHWLILSLLQPVESRNNQMDVRRLRLRLRPSVENFEVPVLSSVIFKPVIRVAVYGHVH
jgi:hypothetical protein